MPCSENVRIVIVRPQLLPVFLGRVLLLFRMLEECHPVSLSSYCLCYFSQFPDGHPLPMMLGVAASKAYAQ